LVDFDIGVTFRTRGHTDSRHSSRLLTALARDTARPHTHEPDKTSNYSENLINSATSPTARMSTIKTVVVADDTAFVRDRFATALLGAGHTALTVKSAAELLVRVRADLSKMDLIVLDLRLPYAGGVELVRSIRKLDQGRLPILVFSGTIGTAEEGRERAGV